MQFQHRREDSTDDKRRQSNVRSEVLTAVAKKVTAFWDVMLCTLIPLIFWVEG